MELDTGVSGELDTGQLEEDWGCGELDMPQDNGKPGGEIRGIGEALDSSGEIEELELSAGVIQDKQLPPVGQNDNSRQVKLRCLKK